MKCLKEFLIAAASLTRWKLSLMVAVSALIGYGLGPFHPGVDVMLFLGVGVVLLAGGCSALNQVQEREIDAVMERTRRRPLPSGRLSVRTGFLLALALLAGGLYFLWTTGSMTALGLGVSAVFWYNGLYTWLKKHWAFAVLPGALCGAIPPIMGWSAAGGHPADFRIVLVAGIFFLWQMPHFWLLLSRHRQDYQRAGLPNIFDIFSEQQAARIILQWLLTLGVGLLLPPAFGMPQLPVVKAIYLAGVLGALLCLGAAIGRKTNFRFPKRMFAALNLFVGLATVILLLDQILA